MSQMNHFNFCSIITEGFDKERLVNIDYLDFSRAFDIPSKAVSQVISIWFRRG